MSSPKMKHVHAITRTMHLLKNGLDNAVDKHFEKSIERDLVYMTEVRDMLLTMIENPTLPFLGPERTVDNEHPKDTASSEQPCS